MRFLQPISLLAAAGIIVPVLIHLWNVRRGKLRKIGSIQLLKQNAHSLARSLRLSERWLLLLRCLLIMLLAVLLAKPVFTGKATAKGWVLLEPSAKNIYPAFKSMIDSLRNAGFECHAFDTSFRVIDPGNDEVLHQPATIPYWSLLKLLDQKLPAGFPVQLFTGRELRRFEGGRPQVSLNLQWQSTDKMDTTMENEIGPIDTLQISLYADDASSLNYLTAALEAIQKKTRLPITIKTTTSTENADWLFWLSEKPIPNSIKAANVFAYSKGKEVAEPALLMNKDEEPVLFSRLIADSANLQPVWSNAKGQTILSRSGKMYLFHSRLRADWNNMMWSGAFVERLFDLLAAGRTIEVKDNRLIDPQQMAPTTIDKRSTAALMQQKDLRLPFWFLAFALFAAERFISLRTKRKEAYER